MNKLEIIKSIEALKIDKEYRKALEKGIQNIYEENAIDIGTEMAYEILPIYEEEFPKNKAPREALDLSVEYRKNPTELNRKKLKKAAASASASAYTAADAAAWAAANAANAAFYAASASSSAAAAANAVAINAAAVASNAASAAKYADGYAGYEKFCIKYIDKMLEILILKKEGGR